MFEEMTYERILKRMLDRLFGNNKEYGYALNISIADGAMQFYYLSNGVWTPSWTK